MANRILEHEIASFMIVLEKIQFRINKKHGPMTIYKWRQKRIERDKAWL